MADLVGQRINVTPVPGADPEQFKKEVKILEELLKGQFQNLKGEERAKLVENFLRWFSPEGRQFIEDEIAALEGNSPTKRRQQVFTLLIYVAANLVASATNKPLAEIQQHLLGEETSKQTYHVEGLKDGKPVLKKRV